MYKLRRAERRVGGAEGIESGLALEGLVVGEHDAEAEAEAETADEGEPGCVSVCVRLCARACVSGTEMEGRRRGCGCGLPLLGGRGEVGGATRDGDVAREGASGTGGMDGSGYCTTRSRKGPQK